MATPRWQVALGVGIVLAIVTFQYMQDKKADTASAEAACSPKKFVILEKQGQRGEYKSLRVKATIRNDNKEACGVRMLTTLEDKAGHVVKTSKDWPASTANIPPGKPYTFDLLFAGEIGDLVDNYTLEPIEARQWK